MTDKREKWECPYCQGNGCEYDDSKTERVRTGYDCKNCGGKGFYWVYSKDAKDLGDSKHTNSKNSR